MSKFENELSVMLDIEKTGIWIKSNQEKEVLATTVNVLKESGVHVFSNTGDPLEANESLIVLHARTPGKKTIKLKRKADILDIYENKIIAKNTNIFEFNAQLHETKVFFYGNSNDVNSLQKKLKNAKK